MNGSVFNTCKINRDSGARPLNSEYEYDGLGRRVRIHNPNGTTEARDWWFVWDGLRPVSAYAADNDGGIALDVKYFDQGYIFLRDGEVQRIHYAHKDHLGSERNGFAYDAYGNLTKMPFDEFPYEILPLYTGHLYDDAAGLYLAPYRAYDPKIGRWLSREPLGLDGPNLYHYANNDPMNQRDPLGLYSCKQWNEIAWWAGGAIGGGVCLFFPPCATGALLGGILIGGAYFVNNYLNPAPSNVTDMKDTFTMGIPGAGGPVGPTPLY